MHSADPVHPLGRPQYCCSGAHSTPETCPSSGVKFYDFWKQAYVLSSSPSSLLEMALNHLFALRSCPIAYAYAYDESSCVHLASCASSSAS